MARSAKGESQTPRRGGRAPGFEFTQNGIILSSSMKSHELARELGISQKELVNFLQQRRLPRNPPAPLAPGAIEAPRSPFKPTSVPVTPKPTAAPPPFPPPTLPLQPLPPTP